jgi:hypothetical protein
VQINVDRFISDPHRTATQLDRFSIFARHQLIMLKSLPWVLRRRLECTLRQRLVGLNVISKTLAKHADRAESIVPKNSLPQLGQVRWESVLTDLTILWPQSEPTPRSIEWCEIVQRHPLANVGPASIASLLLSQGSQIRARIKIRDFELQEFTSLAAGPGPGPEPDAKRA